uniref:TMC domain-containing protein n=1 Tax=Palpitomonas bilix TaxID=652834 RepID=A0A7S3GFU1_9EUKA
MVEEVNKAVEGPKPVVEAAPAGEVGFSGGVKGSSGASPVSSKGSDSVRAPAAVRFASDEDVKRNMLEQNLKQQMLQQKSLEEQLLKANETVSELKKRYSQAKEEISGLKEKNKELANELETVEREKLRQEEEAAKQKIETGMHGQEKDRDTRYDPSNPFGHLRGDEAKLREEEARKRREKARRAALQSGFEAALETGDYDEYDDINEQTACRKCLSRTRMRFRSFLGKLDFLGRQVIAIEARFGQGVAIYFVFLRWVILVNVSVMLLWVMIIIANLIKRAKNGESFTTLVDSIFPSWMLVSAYSSKYEEIYYAAVCLATFFIILVASLYKYIKEDRLKKSLDLIEKEKNPMRYAKLCFSAWDFTIKTEKGREDLSQFVTDNFKVLLEEDRIAEMKAKRTRKDKVRLYIRRSLGIFLNILFLALAWTGILMLKIFFFSDLKSFFANNLSTFPDFISSNILVIAVVIINGVLPVVTKRLVKMEKWDSPGFILKLQLMRLYAGKILNLLIVAVVQLKLLTGFPAFIPQAAATKSTESCFCVDQVSIEFLKLWAIDTVVVNTTTFVMTLLKKGLSKATKKPGIGRVEFQVSDFLIKLLYSQCILWFALPFTPYIAVFGTFSFFLTFVVAKGVLFRFMYRPVKPWSAKDAGAFFLKFYNITLLLAALIFYVALFVRSSMSYLNYVSAPCHPCGAMSYANRTGTNYTSEDRCGVLAVNSINTAATLRCLTSLESIDYTSVSDNYGLSSTSSLYPYTVDLSSSPLNSTDDCYACSLLRESYTQSDSLANIIGCDGSSRPDSFTSNSTCNLPPFYSSTAISVITSAFSSDISSSSIATFFKDPLVGWTVAFFIFLLFLLRLNSQVVQRRYGAEKIYQFQKQVDTLENVIKKQNKIIEFQKKIRDD